MRTAVPTGARPLREPTQWWPAIGLWLYVALTGLIPLLALLLGALTRAVGLSPAPANWTLANFGEALAGHLCRCTGYHRIVDAIRLVDEPGPTYRSLRALAQAIPGCTVGFGVDKPHGR